MYLIIDSSWSLESENIFYWTFWIISSFSDRYYLVYDFEKKMRKSLSTIPSSEVIQEKEKD